jgi:NAD(P) transhydrogenase subunit alpha
LPPGEIVTYNGVRILATHSAGSVPVNASDLLLAVCSPSSTDETKTKTLAISFADELVKGTLVAKDGATSMP